MKTVSYRAVGSTYLLSYGKGTYLCSLTDFLIEYCRYRAAHSSATGLNLDASVYLCLILANQLYEAA
jgi:hypothetical protein